MNEQFIKLHTWMATDLHLTGNELIVFAVIYSYTNYQGGYAGGMEPLMELTGLVRSKVYKQIALLKEKGYIGLANASKGRVHSTYISLVNCPPTGIVNEATVPPTVPYEGHNRPPTGTLLDNRYIDNPPTPLKRGRARKRKPNRALKYQRGGEDYSAEGLARMGISTGEEFYEGNYEQR